MPNFFELNGTHEDKVIKREQRIYADTLKIHEINTHVLNTTSTAPKQKIKFFLDVIERRNTQTNISEFYRIGKYYELEHTESIQIWNTGGSIDFNYTCSDNINGTFSFVFIITPILHTHITLYISSVVFEDSYYNSNKGWLNPNNPDRLDVTFVDETAPVGGVGNLHYSLIEQDTKVKWINGKTIYKRSWNEVGNGVTIIPAGIVEAVVNLYGSMRVPTNVYLPFPFGSEGGYNGRVNHIADKSLVTVLIGGAQAAFFTVYYTKL